MKVFERIRVCKVLICKLSICLINNLLIKKDEMQVPRVCPIEDYSEAVKSNDKIEIHRLYAEIPKGMDKDSLSRNLNLNLSKHLK